MGALMNHHCPECSASWEPGATCQDHFHACLALEYEHPESFGAVHHLLVICYMLQHNAYSAHAWLDARQMLAGFVGGTLSPYQIRRKNRLLKQNPGSISRGPGLAEFQQIMWRCTIKSIRLSDPAVYCEDIRAWAVSVLADTDLLISRISGKQR